MVSVNTLMYGAAVTDRLTKSDWIAHGLRTLATEGANALKVGAMSDELNVSRGSFYWHFKHRDELIEASLALWERENTTELIPEAEAIEDPLERLRHLVREVYEQSVDAIETALVVAADDPLVAPVFRRVTEARLAFLRRIFIDLGLGNRDAGDRAWLAYAFYIGHHQLGRAAATGPLQPARLDRVVELLATGR